MRQCAIAHRPRTTVVVDDELVWVIDAPTAPPGTARCSSPSQLAALRDQLDDELEASKRLLFVQRILHNVARAVANELAAAPPLPFIGEPFGGRGGTD